MRKLLTIIGLLMMIAMIGACAAPVTAPAEAPAEAAADDAAAPAGDGEIQVGLITKTETNPFFVKMKEGAEQQAAERGVNLLTAAGNFDGDNETQVTAIENMVNAGVDGILITANDSAAIVPTIEKAREAGVLFIALDTPMDPEDATDALFATDNYQAGVLIGQYAQAAIGDTEPVIAMMDGTEGTTVSQLRHDGFLEGFGIAEGDPAIVCVQATNGTRDIAQTAMENCLTANPEINVVYTVNEPAAFGADTALQAAGVEDVVMVSVDGGCEGVRGVVSGQIDATSQQYPLMMASMGIDAIVEYVTNGTEVSGYTDTGVTLITDSPVEGVESEDGEFGLANCWGE